jgi:DNA-binding MurR/RpiR family transcriptional regulator
MVRDSIKDMIGSMSPSYRKIAIYALDNYDAVGFTSVNELSRKIGVSTATLVRFTQFIGFKGYKQFKGAIQEEVKAKLNKDSQVALSQLDLLPTRKQLEKLAENEIGNLEKTLANLDPEDLAAMVSAVTESRRIYVGGFGVSRNIMEIFEYALVSMQVYDVVPVTGSISDYNPRLHSMGPEDSLFVMTMPPYSLEAIQIANFAKKRDTKVFLFSDSPACPIYPLATAAIRCENNSLLLTNSYVGMVAIIQVFVNMILLGSKDNLLAGMQEVKEDERLGYQFMKSQKDVFK